MLSGTDRFFAVLSLVAVVAAAASASGCTTPIQSARLSPTEHTSAREVKAKKAVEGDGCPEFTIWLYPGISSLCRGHTAEGTALSILAGAEMAGMLALTSSLVSDPEPFEPERALVPVTTSLQNLYFYSIASYYIEEDLAQERPYTPRDSLAELVKAPFNLEVLSRPEVFGGILGLAGSAIAFTLLTTDDVTLAQPRYFGLDLPAPAAYGAAAATGTALFTHVAVGEESVFRGVVQSSLARQQGEWIGWIWSSLLFGAVHIANVATMEPEQHRSYLTTGVPFITLTGSYLGLAYKWSDYTLTSPVAIHFWYNLLLSSASYLTTDGQSPIGMGVKIPF